jgi:hypothetical protein
MQKESKGWTVRDEAARPSGQETGDMTKLLDQIHFPFDVKKLDLEELEDLSKEIREVILSTVSRNGGHLASNLGVVELTLALHVVFDLPRDKLIWDVGHQSYTHKLLTGRAERFQTLRQDGGSAVFQKGTKAPLMSSIRDTAGLRSPRVLEWRKPFGGKGKGER